MTLRPFVTRSLTIFAILWLPSISLGQTQGATDNALRAVVAKYVASYQSKDLGTALQQWDQKAPDFPTVKVRLRDSFLLNSQIETRDWRVLGIEGEKATALVTLVLTPVKKQVSPGEKQQSRNLGLVQQAGQWKVSHDALVEDDLAIRLLGATSDEDRKAILFQQSAFVDVALRKSLADQVETLRNKGDYAHAQLALDLARQVAQQTNDSVGTADLNTYEGNVWLSQRKYDQALESYQKGLALCQTLNEVPCIVDSLMGMGNVHSAKRESDQAFDSFGRALTVSEQNNDEADVFRSLIAIGTTYYNQSNYPKALENYLRALPLAQIPGNTSRLALVRRNIGSVYRQQGDANAAIESLQQSADLYEEMGNRKLLADVETGLGIINSLRGDYGSAMRYFQKCLAVYEKLGDKGDIAGALGNIGIVNRLQRNYTVALEYQHRFLALSEERQDQDGIARALNNIGLVYASMGDYDHALEAYQKGLALNEKLGNRNEQASVLHNMGATYREQGAYDQALEKFRKSLQIRDELGQKNLAAGVLRSIGVAYELKGDHHEAISQSEQAVKLARDLSLREILTGALTTEGNAYLALGDLAHSRAAYEEAIATVEAMRSQLSGGEQDQQRFFQGMVSPYYRMVELASAQGNASEALMFAEQGKARTLLDVLKSGRVNIDKAMTAAEKAEDRNNRDTIALLNTQLGAETRRAQPDQQRVRDLNAKLETARLAQQEFQAKLYATHPELKVQRGDVAIFKPDEVSTLSADANTAFLEYVVSDNKTYLFVLTGSGNAAPNVAVFTIPLKRKELSDQVGALREKIASHNLLVREPARQAYEVLLKPAAALLRSKTNLIIVPDDVLWDLPFQALLTESNHYLIEQAAISYAPSLTVLREMIGKERKGKTRENPSLLALGNPSLGQTTMERARSSQRDEKLDPLPEAEREVQTLGRLYGQSRSEVHVGPEAREDLAKQEAGRFRILHFATHGIINNSSPMYSHLVLSQGDSKEDGLLEAWELLNLDLHADLVVLSACETARGEVGAGEGVIGLSWALFVAGTPTTVVSQWKVDSAATTQLMVDFHRNHLAATSKAQSLRKAMLRLLADKQHQHPFYWAPFVVIGDAN